MMTTPVRRQPGEDLQEGGSQGGVAFARGCFSKAEKKPEKSDQDKVHLRVSCHFQSCA